MLNTTVKTLNYGTITTQAGSKIGVFSKTMLCSASLVTALLVSGLSLIYVKEQERCLQSEVARLAHMQNSLQVRQGQLLLEQKTLLSQGRLDAMAEKKLQMQTPINVKRI